ncbi:MAG: hypothetical protein C4334_00425 [Pyrinomonas sp.]
MLRSIDRAQHAGLAKNAALHRQNVSFAPPKEQSMRHSGRKAVIRRAKSGAQNETQIALIQSADRSTETSRFNHESGTTSNGAFSQDRAD